MKSLADEAMARQHGTLRADPEVVCLQRKQGYDRLGGRGQKLWLKRRVRTARRHPSGLDGLCDWERDEAHRLGLT